MKHRDLIARITAEGAILIRSSGGHDIYRNPISGVTQPVPRHAEVNEFLARSIIRKLSPSQS